MPRIKETTFYTFDELSDSAKERARDWWRNASAEDNDFAESVIEDAAECLLILGIDVRQRTARLMGGGTRQEPAVYWSGFSYQGDGACFECSYSYRIGSTGQIRAHAPLDTELHRIADGLRAVQRPYFFTLTAGARHTGRDVGAESVSIDVESERRRVTEEDEETVKDLLRDCMHWIYRNLEREYEYRNSDEQVDESIRANEYEFDEGGHQI